MRSEQFSSQFVLEVCVASVDDALAGLRGGCDRLELNMGLEVGGLTPTPGLLRLVREQVRAIAAIPIVTMVRPRGAGFFYSENEYETMRADAQRLIDAGADGLVFGFLTPNRTIDLSRTSSFVAICRAAGVEAVFHRAIDATRDPIASTRLLADASVDRVLSSGGKSTALEGVKTLRAMAEQAAGMKIVAGAGIRSGNIASLAQHLPDCEFHGTFSETKTDEAGVVADADYRTTSESHVRAARDALKAVDSNREK